jgi:hypothetical protein
VGGRRTFAGSHPFVPAFAWAIISGAIFVAFTLPGRPLGGQFGLEAGDLFSFYLHAAIFYLLVFWALCAFRTAGGLKECLLGAMAPAAISFSYLTLALPISSFGLENLLCSGLFLLVLALALVPCILLFRVGLRRWYFLGLFFIIGGGHLAGFFGRILGVKQLDGLRCFSPFFLAALAAKRGEMLFPLCVLGGGAAVGFAALLLRRRAGMAAMLFALCFPFSEGEAAEIELLDVRTPFQGRFRPGYWIPLDLSVLNGDAHFAGALVVTSGGIGFSREMNLPGGARRGMRLHAFFCQNEPDLRVYSISGMERWEIPKPRKRPRWKRLGARQIVIGRLGRPVVPGKEIVFDRGRAYMVDLDDIPFASARDLEMVDMILLEGPLPTGREAALFRWVALGGRLLVLHGDHLSARFLQDGEDAARWHRDGPLRICLQGEGEILLLEKRKMGTGGKASPEDWREALSAALSRCRGEAKRRAVLGKGNPVVDRGAFDLFEPPTVPRWLQRRIGFLGGLLTLFWAALFLFSRALAAGPGGSETSGAMGSPRSSRRGHWAIPAAAVPLSLAFLFLLPVEKSTVEEIRLLTLRAGSTVAVEKSIWSVTTVGRAEEVSLRFPPGHDIRPLYYEWQEGLTDPVQHFQGPGQQMRRIPLRRGGQRLFASKRVFALYGSVSARYSRGKNLSLENRTGVDLEPCLLVGGDFVIPLGRIDFGCVREITPTEGRLSFWEYERHHLSLEGEEDRYRKRILRYALQTLDLRGRLVLVGFQKDPAALLQVEGAAFTRIRSPLWIVHLAGGR